MTGAEAAALVGVVKRFGESVALDRLDLTVRTGDVHALLGPNGAGKTTALNLLLGLRAPDAGTARLLGRDPRDTAARRSIGVTPQDTGFPQSLRVAEIVDLVCAHYDGPAGRDGLLARFGLDGVAHRQAGGLSGGQRRRLAIALAFAGAPRTVFLDEPTTGLDVQARRAVWAEIRAFAATGGTVLLTTHYLEEAEALATRVTVLVDGRRAAEGSVAEIGGATGLTRVRVPGPPLDAPGVTRTVVERDRVTYLAHDTDALLRWLVERGVSLAEIEVRPATLEEAFVSLTEGER